MNRLLSEGFELIHTEAKDGADNKNLFLHPKSTSGVLIELVKKEIFKWLVRAHNRVRIPTLLALFICCKESSINKVSWANILASFKTHSKVSLFGFLIPI